MPQFTAPDLQGANVGFLQPSNPQPDTLLADTIGRVGDLAVKGISMVANKDVKNSMESLQQEYLDTTKPTYTNEEINAVTDFGKQLEMMQQAAKQNKRTSEYRVRAEALLKEKTASFPGLEAEFRSTASGVLGFDPVGTAVAARAAELEDAANESKRRIQEIENRAVNVYNIPLDQLYTKNGQTLYQAFMQNDQEIYRLSQMAKLNELLNPKMPKPSMEEQKLAIVNGHFDVATKQADANTVVAWGTLNSQVSTILGRKVDLRTGSDAELLATIPLDKRKEIAYALEEAKRKSMSAAVPNRGYFETSQWNDYASIVTSPFDKAIAALNSKESLTDFRTEMELSNASVVRGLSGTETGKKVQALKSFGIDPTNFMGAQLTNEATTFIANTLTADPDNDPARPMPSTFSVEENKAVNDSINKWIRDAKANKAKTGEDNPAVDKALMNWMESAAGGADKVKDYRVMGDLLWTLSNKENAEYIKNALSSEPGLAKYFGTSAITYTNRLARTISTRIANDTEAKYFKGAKDEGAPIQVVYRNGKLEMDIIRDVQARGRGGSALERKLSVRYADMVDKVNKSVEAIATLYDMDKEAVYANVLRGTPYDTIKAEETK